MNVCVYINLHTPCTIRRILHVREMVNKYLKKLKKIHIKRTGLASCRKPYVLQQSLILNSHTYIDYHE